MRPAKNRHLYFTFICVCWCNFLFWPACITYTSSVFWLPFSYIAVLLSVLLIYGRRDSHIPLIILVGLTVLSYGLRGMISVICLDSMGILIGHHLTLTCHSPEWDSTLAVIPEVVATLSRLCVNLLALWIISVSALIVLFGVHHWGRR